MFLTGMNHWCRQVSTNWYSFHLKNTTNFRGGTMIQCMKGFIYPSGTSRDPFSLSSLTQSDLTHTITTFKGVNFYICNLHLFCTFFLHL